MAFVRFTAGHRIVTPAVSIYSTGQMAVNGLCLEQYGLRKHKFVVLYYDPDAKKIGIQFTSDDKAEGAYSARGRTGKAIDISGRAFLKCWDIMPEKTQRYTPEYDKARRMLIIQL